jgi:hypothetical protein
MALASHDLCGYAGHAGLADKSDSRSVLHRAIAGDMIVAAFPINGAPSNAAALV